MTSVPTTERRAPNMLLATTPYKITEERALINPKLISAIENQLLKIHRGTGYGKVEIFVSDFKIKDVYGNERERLNCPVTVSGGVS